MSAFLGIDVGGTASRWVLVDGNGDALARGTAPGATGHLFAEIERRRFESAIAAIAAAAPGPIARAHLGVTGLGPRAMPDMATICAAAFGIAPEAITGSDDTELTYRSVFAPGAGHLVYAGTGSIGLHLDPSGRPIRVGGRGILIDDGGSGTWIALTAVERLYRLVDETGAALGAERLAAALARAVGGDSWDDMRAHIYGSDRGRIGALATAVAEAARQGDPMATAVLAQAALELARLANALIRRTRPLPVAFTGRVLDLDPSITRDLVTALPGVEIGFPRPDVALGAARLALGATPQLTE